MNEHEKITGITTKFSLIPVFLMFNLWKAR